MNIQFTDKLSNCCFINLVAHDQHAELLRLVTNKLACGGWGQQHDGDWEIEPATRTCDERPRWDQQKGVMVRLLIAAPARDTYMHNGLPITDNFDWAIQQCLVDRYGQVAAATAAAESEPWRTIYNGGFVNHGSFDKPEWSSHS